MNYVEHHFGDYAKDTRHLSVTEHGAYRLLTDLYYVNEEKLPPSVAECCRLIVTRSAAERKAVESVLREFFKKHEDGYWHKRCESEIERMKEKQEKAKRSAELRWRLRDAHSDGTADAMPSHTEGNAPSSQQPVASSQQPDLKDSQPTAVCDSPLNGTNGAHRIPACPIEEIIALYHAEIPAAPRVTVRNSKRDKLISGRWRQVFADGKAHSKGEGVALFREFFHFVRDSKFLTGRAAAAKDRTPFVADLEWLMAPTNFAKTVEGRYHR